MVPVESSCRTVEPTVAVLSYTVVYCRTVILSILSNCRNTVDYCRTLLSNCRTGAQTSHAHADLALTEAEADADSDGLSSDELLIAMRGVDMHKEFADEDLRELVVACV